MTRHTFEGQDERNYPISPERLEDRPGYPFAGKVPTMPTSAQAAQPEEGSKLSDQAQGIAKEGFEPLTGQNEARRLLDKLEPGEPVFVLRGNDISAAIFVRAWIELQSLNPHVRPRKMRMARQIHLAMTQWKKKDWPT